MMTLCKCGITPNLILHFHRCDRANLVVIYATIGKAYSNQHDFKQNTSIGTISKFRKYQMPQFQKLFRTMRSCFWPHILKLLWNLADHYAQTMFGFSLNEKLLSLQNPLSRKQQIIVNSEAKNKTKNAKEFRHYLRRHNYLYLWIFFQLDLFPTVHQMFEQLHHWSPIIPKFNMDLLSSLLRQGCHALLVGLTILCLQSICFSR